MASYIISPDHCPCTECQLLQPTAILLELELMWFYVHDLISLYLLYQQQAQDKIRKVACWGIGG
jgi:hypothetical protein